MVAPLCKASPGAWLAIWSVSVIVRGAVAFRLTAGELGSILEVRDEGHGGEGGTGDVDDGSRGGKHEGEKVMGTILR